MGRKIQTNGIDKWEVFSSVVDDVIATFQSEHDLKVWLSKEAIYEGKIKAIEYYLSYPSFWTVNDVRQTGSLKKYYAWVESLDYEDDDRRYKQIDEKLKKLKMEF